MTNLALAIRKSFLAGLTILSIAGFFVPGILFAQNTVARDDSAITPPNSAVSIIVVANDTAGSGSLDLPGVVVKTAPDHALSPTYDKTTGTFTYTPSSGFSGTDSFVYTICDIPVAPAPKTCADATVSILVANEVDFDVIPKKLNVKKNGVLPVVIRSSQDFDVTTINPDTLTLEGVAPLRWNMGPKKLTLKFSAKDVVSAIGSVKDRDVVVLQLAGTDVDGVAIFGEDPVIIISTGKSKK